jgi:hypothetical protein
VQVRAIIVVFGVFPAMVAIGAMGLSLRAIARAFGPVQILMGVSTIGAALWSLLVLKRIFLDGAWPTYLPHLIIAGCVVVAALQSLLARRVNRIGSGLKRDV